MSDLASHGGFSSASQQVFGLEHLRRAIFHYHFLDCLARCPEPAELPLNFHCSETTLAYRSYPIRARGWLMNLWQASLRSWLYTATAQQRYWMSSRDDKTC